LIIVALLVVLMLGGEEAPPRTVVILEPTPSSSELPAGETKDVAAPHRDPERKLEPTLPPLIPTPIRKKDLAGDDIRGRPAATKRVEPPAPDLRPTEAPAPTQPPDPDPGGEADPRDSAPTMREARSLVSTVENSTDRLTKSFREYLKALGEWRPNGDNLILWEEIRTLERATDRLIVYLRKRQGISKLRRKKHPTGWTLDELEEVRIRVREVAERVPYVESAIGNAQTNSDVRGNWRSLRSRIDDLEERVLEN
jgi:hypothetical protein